MTGELTIHTTQAAIPSFRTKLPFFFLFPFRFGPAIFKVWGMCWVALVWYSKEL
jgi:hypothetical protein